MIFDSVDSSLSYLSKSIIFPNFYHQFIVRFDQIPKDLSKIPYFHVDSTLIYRYTPQFELFLTLDRVQLTTSRSCLVNAHYKTPWNCRRWISIGGIRFVSSQFNLDCYNSRDQRSRLRWSGEPRLSHVSIDFKWKSKATIHRTIGRPLRYHVIACINRSIATRSEGSDHATSRARYKIFKKLIFN